ncbi:MAG: NRAMP family divalent metal transporter [Terriglobales bacterium]
MPVVTERRRRRRPLPHLPAHDPGTSVRALGGSVVTGAADDDPVAIGTYASIGASLGTSLLWAAPLVLPFTAVVVYLASKLGHVTGQGLVAVIRNHYGRGLLWVVVGAVLVGNLVEAAADLGGIGAGLNLLVPVPIKLLVVVVGAGILALMWFGSYRWIQSVFRWLALALVAYIGAAVLAGPQWREVLRATLVPHLHWDRTHFAALVGIVGTALSPYLFVWQASQEVEQDVDQGMRRLSDRKGTTARELRATAWDVLIGIVFDVVVMYFIMLSTASTLYPAPWGSLESAAAVARALRPMAGHAAGALFAAGIIGVGFIAVPVMTAGAAYALCDARGWQSGLSRRRGEARGFYALIAAATALAVGLNFLDINPIHALVAAGIIEGVLAPVLIVLMLLLTCNRAIMGPWRNRWWVNALAGLAAAASVAAVVGMVVS